jgi:diphosphomevalonate decarboxylase
MKTIHSSAPINIALIKYWGKQDEQNVIPFNGSISLSLEVLRTHTYLSPSSDGFQFFLNQHKQTHSEHLKIRRFLQHFTNDEQIDLVRIDSFNDVPTAAGVASSASGFAALALAAKTYFSLDLNEQQLNTLTRYGSGSACRSLYSGAVIWQKDGRVYSLREDLNAYKMLVVLISSTQKSISSRMAMQNTVKTSPFYAAWVQQAESDLNNMQNALLKDHFSSIGTLMERNFLAMHASMMAAYPPIHYIQDESWKMIQALRELRETTDIEAYCTMDAGSNVKILYRVQDEEALITYLKAQFAYPILSSRIGQGAMIHED